MYIPFALVILLIIVAGFDVQWQRIPHVLTVGGVVCSVAGAYQLPAGSWQLATIGAIVLFLLFWGFQQAGKLWFGRPVLGFGDVMLAMMLGAMSGIVDGLLAAAIGMLLAGIYSLVGLVRGRLQRDSTIPYGIFLAIGGLMVLMRHVFSQNL